MNKTNISYLDFTWNPIHGCSEISVGCKECWARKMANRQAGIGTDGYNPLEPFKPMFMFDKLNEPVLRKKPAIIGVGFMGDLFHEDFTDEQIDQIFAVMAMAKHHKYILLTKRPYRMQEYLSD